MEEGEVGFMRFSRTWKVGGTARARDGFRIGIERERRDGIERGG